MLTNSTKNFGLDFSDNILRLVQFENKAKDIKLKAFGEIKLSPGLITEGAIVDQAKVKQAIEKLLKNISGSLSSKNVIASLPERKSFIKVVELAADANIGQNIKEELPNHIPLSLEEIYYDWQNLGKSGDKNRIIIGATPKEIAEAYIKVLESVNLNPVALEIESVAIARSLVNQKKHTSEASVIIDLGYARSTFIMAEGDAVMFIVSDTDISGRNMTEVISKNLKLSTKEAEKAKIIFGLDTKSGKGSVKKVLSPIINSLKDKIIDTMNYYHNNFSKPKPISAIIFCGGGAQLKGLVESLTLKPNIKLKIDMGNPLINFSQDKIKIPSKKLLSYPTALGLALRGINQDD